MKTTLKKRLTFLLVLALLVSLFIPSMLNAAAVDNTIYLAFTSDVHYDTSNEQNNLDVWLTEMQDEVDNLDYMGFCGDIGSAYAATTDIYWDFVQAVIDTADSYVASGFIANEAIFTLGNHEWYTIAGGDYAKNSDNPTAQRFLFIDEAAKTDDYILYSFGAAGSEDQYGSAQKYTSENIDILKAYLETAPTDIPIIVISHFPLHYFASRTTENAADMVELLNNYPNLIYLWGHNHSSSDTYYDNVYIPGDFIETSAGTDMEINFTYAAAGCMSDNEYGIGSAFVKGKGLLIAINGSEVTFTYHDITGTPLEEVTTVDISQIRAINSDGPFTVRFKDGLDDTIIAEQIVEKGDSAAAPEPPVHDGYTFVEWNNEFENITGNMIITAVYEVIKVELTSQSKLDENFVYITVTDADGPVSGKSGTPIVLYPIPCSEDMTVVDAVSKLHELEYADGVDGVAADNPYGFYLFTKLWGLAPELNAMAFTDENYVDAGQKVTGGDIYYMFAYDSTWLTTSFITPAKTEADVGEAISMKAVTMNMNPDYTYDAIGFTADIYVGADPDNLVDTGIDANELGNFTVSFDQPGTYYVVAKDPELTFSHATAIVEVKGETFTPPVYDVRLSTQTININGENIAIQAYNIDGYSYLKLSDIAYVLNGTDSQFSVNYDADTNVPSCITGEAYIAAGDELELGKDMSFTAKPGIQKIIVDNRDVEITAFNIDGEDFIKLRELGEALKFSVDYDGASRTVLISSIEKA